MWGNWMASLYTQIDPPIVLHMQRASYQRCLLLLEITSSRKALLKTFWGTNPITLDEKPPDPPQKPAAAGKSAATHLMSTQMIHMGPHQGTNPLT